MHAPFSVPTIARLVESTRFGDRRVALLHIATPRSAIVGIDIAFDGERSIAHWRGSIVELGSGTWLDDVRAVHDVVAANWCGDDEAVLDVPPVVKVQRSGSYQIAFGADFYLPRRVLVEATFPDPVAVARTFVQAAVDDAVACLADGVRSLGGVECLIHDDGRTVTVADLGGGRSFDRSSGAARTDVDDLGRDIAATIGLTDVVAATIGSRAPDTTDVDYVGTLFVPAGSRTGRRFEVIIPATCGTCDAIGAPYGPAAPVVRDWYAAVSDDVWYDIDGFIPLGRAQVEPGWLARHESSGIVVVVRPAP